MNSQVDYIEPRLLLELSTKNADFTTGVFPVNNNRNIALSLHVSFPSSLDCSAKVQGSTDLSTWFDIAATEIRITTTDDALWTISSLHGITYLRLNVVLTSGSGNFISYGRGT